MNYRGYLARVEYDAADRIFVGHIAGINDIVGFHGESVAGLEAAFSAAVDDYVATCAKAGKAPEKPHSGRVMFRVDPSTHARGAGGAGSGVELEPVGGGGAGAAGWGGFGVTNGSDPERRADAAHGALFAAKVRRGVADADDLSVVRISNDDVALVWQRLRAALVKQAGEPPA